MNVTIDDLFATVGVDGFVVKTCGIFSWKHWWSWCGDGHKREADEKDEQHDEVENKGKTKNRPAKIQLVHFFKVWKIVKTTRGSF